MSQKNTETNPIDNLRALRDQIRVKMHLGEMEARDWWTGVEAKLADVEHQLETGMGKAERQVNIFIDELAHAFERISKRIGDKPKPS